MKEHHVTFNHNFYLIKISTIEYFMGKMYCENIRTLYLSSMTLDKNRNISNKYSVL